MNDYQLHKYNKEVHSSYNFPLIVCLLGIIPLWISVINGYCTVDFKLFLGESFACIGFVAIIFYLVYRSKKNHKVYSDIENFYRIINEIIEKDYLK